MGPWYEIDGETGDIVWQDESTGWQQKRRKYTSDEYLLAQHLAERHANEMQKLLSSFVQD